MFRNLLCMVSMLWRIAQWRNRLFFIIFALLIFFLDQKITEHSAMLTEKISAIKSSQQRARDFLVNRKNYIFESGVSVNQYVSNFITYTIERQKGAKILYLKSKELRNIKSFKSYLPVRVVEFDIGIESRFMPLFTLAQKLKASPFLIIWKSFDFSIKDYPQGEVHAVFYTLVKRG